MNFLYRCNATFPITGLDIEKIIIYRNELSDRKQGAEIKINAVSVGAPNLNFIQTNHKKCLTVGIG